MTLHRGTLYWAELDERRPVLVISPDYRNERARDVIVIPCTTRLRDAPTHVRIRAREGGVAEPTMIKCEQITTLPVDAVDPTPLGPPLSPARVREVERGVLRAIGVPVPE